MFRRISTCCLAVSLAWMSTEAGPPSGDEAIDLAKMMQMAKGGPDKGSDDESPFPKFDEVTKDMESKKGLFTLWSYPPSAKGKDKEKLLCQVPKSFLGEDFMLSVSFSGGGFFTGFPLEERVVRWEQLDKKLLLIEPETGFITDASHTVSDVVRRTYPDRIRVSVPIVTKSPQGDPVIDLGRMLKSDFADISWMARIPMFGGMAGAGGVNASLSKWTTKKSFELNVEIGVELAMRRMSPPGSFDKKQVHFSFWKLPRTSFKPRIADDRVGYFLTSNRDWSKPVDERDIFNRYIDRWHLEKRDPSLSKCEPKKPIVYYIEKTVPVRFRRAVREGILEWNKAFEEVGFINAIEVRQQTYDNEWKDLDPEDMRYSFFRWIVSGGSFAMGPHRSNPFTGEIYDADIIFDDSMVRYYQQEAQAMLPPAATARKLNDPVLRAFLDKNPQFNHPSQDWETFSFGHDHDAELRDKMRQRMRQRGHVACDYAEGMKHQMAVAQTMLAGQPPEVIERFLYDIIKEIVMHEVGHTLGLRHNFKASTIHSLDEIKKRRTTGEALVGSVMDYNPILFFKDSATEGHFITPTIGPWDYWVIEYGYRPADGSYKHEAKNGNGDEDEAEDEEKEETAEPETAAEGNPLKDIPPEVLDKLPPEVRKMLESGGAAAMMAEAHGGGAPHNNKPSGPSFSGPNAAEKKMLHAIASRASEPELVYATDEDTTALSADPRTNRFDMASDPVDWAKERIDLVDNRLDSILDWAVKEGESWYFVRQAFISLIVEKAFILDYVGRYIGGQYMNRAHRGDPDAATPLELVDPDRQRAALSFIADNLYQDEFFNFPPEVLNHLIAPRWWHEGAQMDYAVDFPIHRLIASLQRLNLFDRLFPGTLKRIHDAELKTTDPNRFTVAEYLKTLQDACWGDSLDTSRIKKGSWTDAAPAISNVRRSLQREYLSVIEPLVRTSPGMVMSPDLHAMAQYCLRQLDKKIGKVLESGDLDFASEAHLAACKSRIERILEAELKEYGGIGF
ncbi:MAG: zinc-dependent metalloprotease [Phycisphaerae bacterium]|jgi:hypothetical protein